LVACPSAWRRGKFSAPANQLSTMLTGLVKSFMICVPIILERKGILLRVFSVNRVVSDAMTIIRAHGSQGDVSILPEMAPVLPDIRGNQYQLEQVVVNLLMNAMQANGNDKGTVRIRTEYCANEDWVRIIVTDNGVGIRPEIHKHLFEPFFSTRIECGGSGLGLYISRFIVNEHKGTLSIVSNQSSVQLPLYVYLSRLYEFLLHSTDHAHPLISIHLISICSILFEALGGLYRAFLQPCFCFLPQVPLLRLPLWFPLHQRLEKSGKFHLVQTGWCLSF